MSTETTKTQKEVRPSIRAYIDTSLIKGRKTLTKRASLKPNRSLIRLKSLKPKPLLNSVNETEQEN